MSSRAVSRKSLWTTWVALLCLLGLTWFAARCDLGVGNTIIALFISGAKMGLVMLFFMQIRHSSRLILIFACAGFVWWLLFLSLTMTDYLTRRPVMPYQHAASRSPAGEIPR